MTPQFPPIPAAQVWTGRTISGLAVAFLLLDAGIKLVPIQPVLDGMRQLGFASTPGLARSLGLLLLACTVLYLVPRTAPLGAVLLTGYLGGSIAIHLRLDHPLLTHTLFGGYLGIFIWAGLGLRNRKIRAFFLRGVSEPRPKPLPGANP